MLESDIEMCGTDQKFNCIVGRALQWEYKLPEPQVIISMPILEGLDGVKKMSKSLGNYVAVTDPPNEMFAKLMSISDELMWKYYERLINKIDYFIDLFDIKFIDKTPTQIDIHKNDSIKWNWQIIKEKVEKKEIHPKLAKLNMSKIITENFYNYESARDAWQYFETRHNLSDFVDYPIVKVESGLYKAADLLMMIGLTKTKSDAKRLIQQGGVEWVADNGTPIKIEAFGAILIRPSSHGIIRAGTAYRKIIS